MVRMTSRSFLIFKKYLYVVEHNFNFGLHKPGVAIVVKKCQEGKCLLFCSRVIKFLCVCGSSAISYRNLSSGTESPIFFRFSNKATVVRLITQK